MKIRTKAVLLALLALIVVSGCAETTGSLAGSPDQARVLVLAEEAQDLLNETMSEASTAMASGDLYTMCAALPSLESKFDRIDSIVSEMRTLDLDPEQSYHVDTVEDSMSEARIGLALAESGC